jgi:hypothetical protein
MFLSFWGLNFAGEGSLKADFKKICLPCAFYTGIVRIPLALGRSSFFVLLAASRVRVTICAKYQTKGYGVGVGVQH